jgi:hypothetical protein
MTIQEEVNKAINRKDLSSENRNLFKLLKAEFQREPTKEISDKKAISIIKRMIKNNEEMIEYKKDPYFFKERERLFTDNVMLHLFIPKSNISDDDVKNWIKENIDFSQYKNKMQAMKPIMQHFKDIDGNKVKEILEQM